MTTTKEMPVFKEEVKGVIQGMKDMLPPPVFEVFNTDAHLLGERYTGPLKLRVGDKAPLFEAPNATGKPISLESLLHKGPVVLVFYRGEWCPFCNLALNAYQRVVPQIKELGASLVAISPQTPDHSLSIAEKNALQFEVLSDAGNKVARQYTTVFKNGDAPVAAMAQLGVEFNSFYSDNSAEIPVPAVYIINKEGNVVFAKSEGGDYMKRTEPAEILEALKGL